MIAFTESNRHLIPAKRDRLKITTHQKRSLLQSHLHKKRSPIAEILLTELTIIFNKPHREFQYQLG